jgi:hypothetical protein
MEGVKIYGLCLERLRHQITKAKERAGRNALKDGQILLECYNTGEPDDIIDILELYDLKDGTCYEVKEKLDDLAYTVSELTRERVVFGYTDEGHLGLYLALNTAVAMPVQREVLVG